MKKFKDEIDDMTHHRTREKNNGEIALYIQGQSSNPYSSLIHLKR